jgi:hypothetical protein
MKKAAAILFFSVFSFTVFAQGQDPKSPGFDFGGAQPDTTAAGVPGDTTQQQQAPAESVKPYERLVLYVDSVTNLVSYVGVVEPKDINVNPDETTSSDSLYVRAKRWAAKRFAGGGKTLFDVDKKNQKLVINGWMPAYAYGSKYTKRNIGKYEFKMSVWFREGRYKYQITNLVHEGIKPNDGNAVRNYFEFYYTSPNNIKGNDITLRNADKDINKLIADFKKRMKDPVIVDEEDW